MSDAVSRTLPGAQKTRIVATIGPASDAPEVIEAMIREGMTVARLNFSHGTFEEHGERIRCVRAASRAAGREVAILVDLPGPKIRIGELAKEPLELETGSTFVLTTDLGIAGDARRVSVNFPRLPQVVKPGDRLFLNDGLIQLEVTAVGSTEVTCAVRAGGELRSRKGLNLPGVDLGMSAFTRRDRDGLAYALEHGVDAVSQSFVESAADVEAVRTAARELGHPVFIVAKIERIRALDRFDEILAVADGIMVARGDLGVEVPIERMALYQKDLIRRSLRAGKPVITATQMLESMVASRRPTRAEATDVANAVLDGTDAVMLSGESATGKYPVEAVATLAHIAAATEPHRSREGLWERMHRLPQETQLSPADLLSLSVEAALTGGTVAAVVVPTRGGTTARSLARLRLPVWIHAITPDPAASRRLLLSYGVHSVYRADTEVDWTAVARAFVSDADLPGSLVLLIQGPSPGHPDANYRLELIDLKT